MDFCLCIFQAAGHHNNNNNNNNKRTFEQICHLSDIIFTWREDMMTQAFFHASCSTRISNASVFSLRCLSIGALKICFFQYPTPTQQLLFKAAAQFVCGLRVYGSFSGFHVERNLFVPNNSRVKKLWQYTVGLLCLLCCRFIGNIALDRQYSFTDLT